MSDNQKKCPRCGVSHCRKGIYCSLSCANVREQPAELREAKSKKLKAYHASPEGIATASISRDFMLQINREKWAKPGEYLLQDEDWMLDITFDDSEDSDIYSDGKDIWSP
jgi:hypothetical protein